LFVGTPRLQDRLAGSAGSRPTPVAFAWPSSAPSDKATKAADTTWVPRPVQDELMAAAQRGIARSPDPFSADGLRRIAETAAGSGWFDHITSVRREADGSVRVEGQWRTPAAVVRRDNDYLIARKGEVLPLVYERGSAPVKAIIGVKQD